MGNYTKPVIATQWLKDYMIGLGYNQNQIIEAAGLDKNNRSINLKVMPYPNLLTLLEWLANDRTNPDIGFDLSLGAKPGDLGPVTLLAYQTPTLKDFFETIIKYQPLITSGIDMQLNIGVLETELNYRLLIPNRPGSRVDIDYTLKMFADVIKSGKEKCWLPVRVEVTYPEPDDVARLHQEFGNNISFDQPSNSLIFESYLLDKTISKTDPQLLELMHNEIHQLLEGFNENSNLLSRIRAYIASSLASGNCSSMNIARQLNISQRTMVRHLATLNTSFREIKAEIIEELAKTALSKTQSSIYEIAIQMGFSETSVFDRMFKKKTGYTPMQFREKYLVDDLNNKHYF